MKNLFFAFMLLSASIQACEVYVIFSDPWPCDDLIISYPGNSFVVVEGVVYDLPQGEEITFSTSCTENAYFEVYNTDDELLETIVITGPNLGFTWIIDCITLSVELSYFRGQVKEKIELEWETISEVNVSHFEIQLSTSNDFQTVGIIPAKGPSTYNFSCNNLFNQDIYARLISVDHYEIPQLSDIIHLPNDTPILPVNAQIYQVNGQLVNDINSQGVLIISDGKYAVKQYRTE